ncbi:MAG: oligosaccharide flippase family protein [Roseiarcus sp.]|jgi:O-antigen/teichoic acid export membrane protein
MIVGLAFVSNTVFNFLVALLVARFLGPAEYGRFAIAWAGAVLINTAGFDWIRLSAVRFYSRRVREERPAVRATLDACFAALALVVALGALTLSLSGLDLPLSPGLIVLTALTGVANGLYDLRTALARARFFDRAYIVIVLVKNGLGLVLTVGGALAFGSAKIALAGACLSIGLAMAATYRDLRDPEARLGLAERPLAWSYFGYAGPFIVSSVLFQLIPFAGRILAGTLYGYDEAGQFSLANDIGVRVLAAIASALDVILFQQAVRAEETLGREGARAQIADNMAFVVAVVLPAAVGFWLCLPGIEALIAPKAYRGPFSAYLGPMLPGLAAFVLMTFAVAPIFQIAKRTAPMILAALAAIEANVALVATMPRGQTGYWLAEAQSGALVVGLAVALLLAWGTRPQWPRARDILGALAATGVMALALWPLRGLEPNVAVLAAQTSIGVAIYGALAWLFDIARMRERVKALIGSSAAATAAASIKNS